MWVLLMPHSLYYSAMVGINIITLLLYSLHFKHPFLVYGIRWTLITDYRQQDSKRKYNSNLTNFPTTENVQLLQHFFLLIFARHAVHVPLGFRMICRLHFNSPPLTMYLSHQMEDAFIGGGGGGLLH